MPSGFSEQPHEPAAPRSPAERKASAQELHALGEPDRGIARAFACSRRQAKDDRADGQRTDRGYALDPELVVEGGLWYRLTYGRLATDEDLNSGKARANRGERAYRSHLGWRSHKDPDRTRALPRPQDIREVFDEGGMSAYHEAVKERMKTPYVPIDLPQVEKTVARARSCLAGRAEALLYYPRLVPPAPCFGPPSDVIAMAGVRGHTAIIGDDPVERWSIQGALLHADGLDRRLRVVIDEALGAIYPEPPSSMSISVRPAREIKKMLETHLKHRGAAEISMYLADTNMDFEFLRQFIAKRRTPIITASWEAAAGTNEASFFNACATQYVYPGFLSGLTALDAIPMQWDWWWLLSPSRGAQGGLAESGR